MKNNDILQLERLYSDIHTVNEAFNDNAYVFDVDDTLVTTDAKVLVRDEQGNLLRKLTPSEYNTYERQTGEVLDFSEFESSELFHQTAAPTSYLKVMKNISDAVDQDRSDSFLYILTARGNKIKDAIHTYLKDKGIDVRPIEIHTIGDDTSKPISQLKKQVIQKIRDTHIGDVVFFDDDEKNINLAKEIRGVKARHVRL